MAEFSVPEHPKETVEVPAIESEKGGGVHERRPHEAEHHAAAGRGLPVKDWITNPQLGMNFPFTAIVSDSGRVRWVSSFDDPMDGGKPHWYRR